jgi:hypothetical protein
LLNGASRELIKDQAALEGKMQTVVLSEDTCHWTVPHRHVVYPENPPVANTDNKLVQISTQPSSRDIPVGISQLTISSTQYISCDV